MERRMDYVDIDTITPAANNPKGHAIDTVRASIDRFGYVAPMVIDDRTGNLVVGHGRLESLKARRDAGETPPEGVTVDDHGRWHAPVIRGWASRSDADAAAYLIADNRHTELGGWDHADLSALLEEIGDPDLIELTGWDPADLEALIDADDESSPPGTADDHIQFQPVEQTTVFGDLWILDGHRVLCGDSTDPDHIERVLADVGEPGIIYTDPPYGIRVVDEHDGRIGDSWGTRVGGQKGNGVVVKTHGYMPVAGDGSIDTAVTAFTMATTRYPAAKHVWWGANYYTSSASVPNSRCWLIWDKETNGDFADGELAWTNHHGSVRIFHHVWNGLARATEHALRIHPTQKPVALAEWAFGIVDKKNERGTVLDLFGGSGSALIAAHNTGRTAAIIEMEPYYVDAMCARYQQHTGTIPIRVRPDGTTEPHDFTASTTP